MPAIALHQLSYSTPDGHTLFTDLDLSFGPVRTGLVGRNGVGKSTLLRLIAGALTPASGTIAVDGVLGVLGQTIQVEPETSVATFIGIETELARLKRLETGAGSVADAADADWTLPSRLSAAFADLALPDLDPERTVATLSGGQRTRLALAGLILRGPDMVLLDEPTNNLDGDGRAAVADMLDRWRGGAIVVSHDRTLLRRMDAILELTTLGASVYGGNWDHYRERKAVELAAAEHGLATAERQVVEIDRRIQAQVERKSRKDAAGHRQRAKGGLPRIVAGAMQRRAEETTGANARLASRLGRDAGADAAAARSRIEVLQPFSVSLSSAGLPAGRRVLEAVGLTGGPMAGAPIIRDLDLVMEGPERVAVTGPNGSGKTTLLRLIAGELSPEAGTARILVAHAVLDQTVSLLRPGETIRENYRRLNPADDENSCRAALARFKFRAEAALQSVGSLSGGEMLRAGLAATIGAAMPPQLLILDEPTNHLDLEAIEAVEAGLRAYDGALLVISHDRDFLEAIGIEREITLGPDGQTRSKLK